ncbi:hypothetical protein [Pseudoduganella namucuonensis]|uniref:Uncharacterized protein n=1 Tax=Pseudoduganella namucuonensis TaxID=1035707 RepID=A0A1I7GZ20_9BURK|nr:hypothetical protein [Pseudoduganella namucuonensis]SFU53687.1 hypothetical protein SAMN05216552_1004208 [Pseudoduganella namucuonensis]
MEQQDLTDHFHIYVRTASGERLSWTETTASDLSMADEAYLDLLTRPDFEGSPFTLVAAFKEHVFCVYDFEENMAQINQLRRNAGRTDWLRTRSLH